MYGFFVLDDASFMQCIGIHLSTYLSIYKIHAILYLICRRVYKTKQNTTTVTVGVVVVCLLLFFSLSIDVDDDDTIHCCKYRHTHTHWLILRLGCLSLFRTRECELRLYTQ